MNNATCLLKSTEGIESRTRTVAHPIEIGTLKIGDSTLSTIVNEKNDEQGGRVKPNKMAGVREENPAPARRAGPPTTGERQNPDAEPQKPVEKISFDAIDTNDIKAKLQQLGDNFGNKGNRPTQIKNAQRAIEEFLAGSQV